ncbi:MAG TPA: DUF3300 domain-containing protein [Pyrinomonadaceae bacterium]|nr:DUF3300 domain-containing protein [Pyrinomonadaceae bacterium]
MQRRSVQAQDDAQDPQSVPPDSEAMQQLVAPIALYPDALIAQILAASTYPDQIVEADRCIKPATPEVCYVPDYDPWLAFGAPIRVYPGYLYHRWVGGPYVSFGMGIGIGGFWGGFDWGWNSWSCNWRGHSVVFNHNIYVSHSQTFFNGFNLLHAFSPEGPRTPSALAAWSLNFHLTHAPSQYLTRHHRLQP